MGDRVSAIRLFVPDDLGPGLRLLASAGQLHYLGSVMRRRAGDQLVLFNGRDGAWLARIDRLDRKQAELACLEQIAEQKPGPDIWLLFVPVKRARLDFIAQKATELGVSKIWPIQSERGQVGRVKDARLEANIIEAAEQTERLDLPELASLVPLDRLIAGWPADRWLIFCDEAQAGTSKVSLVDELAKTGGQKAAILIGPEGGFSPAERELIKSLPKALPIALGPRILRADTAALAALAIWQCLCGDWQS